MFRLQANSVDWDKPFKDLVLRHFPAKSKNFVTRYLEDENLRVRNGNFSSRLRYELDFFYARGSFPFRSCLLDGQYRYALGNILNKFAANDVFLVSLPKL
jgi:hypothetical protein